jgi:hypothetical protein
MLKACIISVYTSTNIAKEKFKRKFHAVMYMYIRVHNFTVWPVIVLNIKAKKKMPGLQKWQHWVHSINLCLKCLAAQFI